MEKVKIELTIEQYKNTHLILHNLIELTGSLSKQNQVFQDLNCALTTIKTTLEVK